MQVYIFIQTIAPNWMNWMHLDSIETLWMCNHLRSTASHATLSFSLCFLSLLLESEMRSLRSQCSYYSWITLIKALASFKHRLHFSFRHTGIWALKFTAILSYYHSPIWHNKAQFCPLVMSADRPQEYNYVLCNKKQQLEIREPNCSKKINKKNSSRVVVFEEFCSKTR